MAVLLKANSILQLIAEFQANLAWIVPEQCSIEGTASLDFVVVQIGAIKRNAPFLIRTAQGYAPVRSFELGNRYGVSRIDVLLGDPGAIQIEINCPAIDQ